MSKESVVNFRTNALLKSILGKDLITDDNIAVLELVKNSFDANSKTVNISFLNIKKNDDKVFSVSTESKLNTNIAYSFYTQKTSKIIIQDYGVGMQSADIIDKWLNIAYSEKKGKQREFGRSLAGNKGVGRFSCDRLGEFLDLYTKSGKNKPYVHLKINWNEFDVNENKEFEIQKVNLELNELDEDEFVKKSGFSPFNRGTILEISKLRSNWNHAKILKLRRNLEKLLNPNQAFRKDKFEILLEAKEFIKEDKSKASHERINGVVENKVFKELGFKTTRIQSKITKDFIITILKDKGRKVFTLVERNNEYPLLNNVKINLYYLSFYPKVYFKRNTGIRTIDFGSVFLFINGFRIPPYGDSGDDWLGLEKRKSQGFARYLGTREILGNVVISDKIGSYRIISNRAGVINDPNFAQLVDSNNGYYIKIHRRLEKFVEGALKWDSTPFDKGEQAKVEKKILSSRKWDESKEVYSEELDIKEKRALSIILNIINAKKENILRLKIDESLVSEIINRETERIEDELSQIIEKFKKDNITSEQVRTVIEKLDKEQKDLINSLSALYNISNDIAGLETIVNKHKSFANVRENAYSQLQELQNELLKIEDEKQKAEAAAAVLAEKLRLEKEKNTYLTATNQGVSHDAKGLIHNIKITSGKILSNVDTIINKINSGHISNKELLRRLGTIKFNADKAMKISKLITRANFKTQAEKQVFNLPKFLSQYIEIYSDIYERNQLEFVIDIDDSLNFESKKSILELSIVFDNLISNAEKANASKILIEVVVNKNKELEIFFSDNGVGVDKQFLDDPSVIFDLGITTTEGSGIGLYSVKEALKKMKGKIRFLGNNIKQEGATFLIVFSE